MTDLNKKKVEKKKKKKKKKKICFKIGQSNCHLFAITMKWYIQYHVSIILLVLVSVLYQK